jgi:hypothetical protein
MTTPQLTAAQSILLIALGAALALVMLAVVTNWRGVREWHALMSIRSVAIFRKGPLRRLPDVETTSSKRFTMITEVVVSLVFLVLGVAVAVLGVVTLLE